MSFIRILMLDFGIFNFLSLSMECSCMAPLTPAVMVIRGLVVHPLFWMVLFSGSYLACFCVMAYFVQTYFKISMKRWSFGIVSSSI